MKFRKLTAGIIAAVMAFTAVATPLGDNLPLIKDSVSTTASAASWSSDYRKWSQGGSGYSAMRSSGCWVVAQAKLIKEIGAAPSGFNPDVYYNWEKNNGFISGSIAQLNGSSAPCTYAKQRGVSLTFVGSTIAFNKNIDIKGKIMDNVNKGYYTIICFSTSTNPDNNHFLLVGNALSKANKEIWLYNSNENSSAEPSSLATYTKRAYKNVIERIYTYKASGTAAPSNQELWQVNVSEGVNVRKGPGTNYSVVKAYPKGTSVYITEKKSAGGYTWGKCSDGWLVLNFCKYISGSLSHTHSYGSWYTKTAATCTAAGTDERKCSCGKTETRSTSALGHNYGSWTTSTSASCNGAGIEKRTCSRCGSSETRSTPALGHNYGSWYTAVNPGCTTNGTEKRVCSRCGSAETRSVSALGHSYGSWYTAVNPGCTTNGSEKRVCSRCSNAEYRSTAALGHSYSLTWTVDRKATCSAEGSKSRHCTRCDAKIDIISIDKIAHTYTSTIVKPTLDEQGYTLYTCSVCGDSYKDDYTAKREYPSKVAGLIYGARNTDYVSLRWDKDENADGYIVEYLSGNKFVKLAEKTSRNSVSHKTTELEAGKLYKFRVRSYINVSGKRVYGEYSDVLNVTTIPEAMTGLALGARTDNSISLKWDKNTTSAGTEIEICQNGKWSVATTKANNSAVSHKITQLKAGTEYSFRIRPFVIENGKKLYGKYSDMISISTLAPKAVTGFTAGARNAEYISLKWDKAEGVDGYIVEYLSGNKFVKLADKTSGLSVSHKVASLKAGTLYKFRIKSYVNVNGKRVYSEYRDVLNVRTLPKAMTGLTLGARTDNSVSLKWDKNASADGSIVEMFDGKGWKIIATKASNTSTSHKIIGLKAATAYKFRVRAYINDEDGRIYSVYNTVINEVTAPSDMKNFRSTITAKTAIRFNWDKNTTADGYSFEMIQNGKWTTVGSIIDNSVTNYTQLELTAGTDYRFRIRAYKTINSNTVWSGYSYVNASTAK